MNFNPHDHELFYFYVWTADAAFLIVIVTFHLGLFRQRSYVFK